MYDPDDVAISSLRERLEKSKVVIGDCVLYNEDCAFVLPTLAGRKIDAIVSDPPYAIPTMVASGREMTRSVGDLSIAETAFRMFFDQWSKVLSPDGRVLVFCDGSSYPVVFRAAFNTMNTALLIWDKGQIGMGREFRKSHELIMHAWKAGAPIFADGVGRADILKYAPVSSGDRRHPAEKPVPLLVELIRPCGDVILDPFMGSASAGIAALKLGRKFIGIEIEPRYFDIACKRIEQAYAQGDLFVSAPSAKAKQLDLEDSLSGNP